MRYIIIIFLSCFVLIEGAHVTAHLMKNDVHGWVTQYCNKQDDDW